MANIDALRRFLEGTAQPAEPPPAPGTVPSMGGTSIPSLGGTTIPSMGSSGTMGSGHVSIYAQMCMITAQTVAITAQNVTVSGGGSVGGAAGNSVGAGAAAGAAAGGAGMASATAQQPPAAPGVEPQEPWQESQGKPKRSNRYEDMTPAEQFRADVISNPSISGIASAGFRRMSAESLGTLGFAAQTISAVDAATVAAFRPMYDAETRQLVAAASGRYISPQAAAASMQAAGTRGGNAAWRSLIDSSAGEIPFLGGAAKSWYEMNYGMDADRQADIQEAAGQADEMRARLGGFAGRPIGFSTDSFLSLRNSEADSTAMFGSKAIGSLLTEDFRRRTGGGRHSEADIASGDNIVFGYAALPQNQTAFDLLSSGSADSKAQAAKLALPALIARGDVQGIVKLANAGYLDASERDEAIRKARQAGMYGVTQDIAGSNLSIGSSGISLAQATGASIATQGAMMTQLAGNYNPIIQSIQSQIAIEVDPVRKAELQAQLASAQAQQAQMANQGARTAFGSQQQMIGVGMTMAQTTLTRAMYTGTEGDVTGAYRGLQGGYLSQADLFDRMSQDTAHYGEEERAGFRAQAEQARLQAQYDVPRQEGGYRYGLRQGELGILGSQAQYQTSTAGLYGGVSTIASTGARAAETIYGGQLSLLQREANGEFGPKTQQERLDIEKQIIETTRQFREALEGANRSLYTMNISVAQAATGIAGNRESQAFMSGVGGVQGFGFAQTVYTSAQETTRRSQANVDHLRSIGVASDNPAMIDATSALSSAQLAETQAKYARTNVPISIGLQSADSAYNYQMNALSSVPGTYGNIRGALQGEMGVLQKEAQEIRARMAAQEKADGGLDEATRFQYDQQLRAIGMRQAQTFQQLSIGWESRLINQTINTPGSFAFISPSLSMRSAVNGGVRSPLFGSNDPGTVPEFLAQAHEYASIAGSTGTASGFAATALTGVPPRAPIAIGGLPGAALRPGSTSAGGHDDLAGQIASAVRSGIQGMTIMVRIPLPGGGYRETPATVTFQKAGIDPSSSGVGESQRLSGSWVPRQ